MKKRMSRRQFAKIAGGAALAAPWAAHAGLKAGAASAEGWRPAAAGAATPLEPLQAQQPAEAPKPESKLKLTPEQEERLKQANERRERQMAPLRNRELPYELEPAFVFRVKNRG